MNTGHGQKWGRKKELAIGALLACPTVKQAAQFAGISEPTLHRWMKIAEFKAEYDAARIDTLKAASERLQRGTLAAVETLQEIAGDRKAPSASRVMAARCFLECCGLLKGTAVTVNNNLIPQDAASIDSEIVKMLSGVLRNDPVIRESLVKLIAELDASDAEKVRVN
jgi:hypothetical protein